MSKYKPLTMQEITNLYTSSSLSLTGNIGNDPVSISGRLSNDSGIDPYLHQLVQINERLYDLQRFTVALATHFGFSLIEKEMENNNSNPELELKITDPIKYMKTKKELNE